MNKFFRIPFAKNGDKQIIPNVKNSDGYVSYDEGYGNDYSRDPSVDARAKPIEREGMNTILNHITTAIRQFQTQGYPEWISEKDNDGESFAYDSGVIVLYNGIFYLSLVSNNTATPGMDDNSWRIHDTANYLLKGNNLSDLTSADTARTNLGLGTMATQNANNVMITGGAIHTTGDITSDGKITAAGMITTQTGLVSTGDISTSADIYEKGQRVYSPNNPPPYPVTSVNWETGNVMTATAVLGAGGWHRDGATGMITQWGIITRSGYVTPVTFPTTFPNGCMGVFLTLNTPISDLADSTNNIRAVNPNNSGFTYASAGVSEISSFWFAIGY